MRSRRSPFSFTNDCSSLLETAYETRSNNHVLIQFQTTLAFIRCVHLNNVQALSVLNVSRSHRSFGCDRRTHFGYSLTPRFHIFQGKEVHNLSKQSRKTQKQPFELTGCEQLADSHPLCQKYETGRTSPVALEPQHWVNLTNGVEMLPKIASFTNSNSIRFTRIQSSHCESGAYDKLLRNVDNDMLLSLAVGRPCLVYDLASRNKNRGVPRAIFLGLQFLKWAIAYLWFGTDLRADLLVPSCVLVRGKNVVPFWMQTVLSYKVGKDTKKRIRYFLPYVREMGTTEVRLYGVFGIPSLLDGCIMIHAKFVRDWIELRCNVGSDKSFGITPDLKKWLEESGFAVFDSHATFEQLQQLQRQLSNCQDLPHTQANE